VDTESVELNSGKCQLSDQSVDAHGVGSAVSDSIQSVRSSCAESVAVSESQAMATEQKGVVVGLSRGGIRTRLGRLDMPVSRLIQTMYIQRVKIVT
jgi:hypothetical protein